MHGWRITLSRGFSISPTAFIPAHRRGVDYVGIAVRGADLSVAGEAADHLQPRSAFDKNSGKGLASFIGEDIEDLATCFNFGRMRLVFRQPDRAHPSLTVKGIHRPHSSAFCGARAHAGARSERAGCGAVESFPPNNIASAADFILGFQ